MEKSPIVIDMIEPSVIPRSQMDRQVEIAILQRAKMNNPSINPSSTFDSSNIDLLADYNKPDYELMKKRRDETHARNKYKKPYDCSDVCCNFTTGWHNGISTTTESDSDKFGTGMVLYFRFVKYLACFFLIFTLLSVPSLFFTISATDDFSVKGLTDYKGVLYFSTLGSLKRGVVQCAQGQIGDQKTFTCEKGKLGPLSTLQYGRITESSDLPCDYLTMYSWDSQCNNDNTLALVQAYTACEGLESCSITISSNFFDFSKPECSSYDPFVNPDAQFYFNAYCESSDITLAGNSSVSKRTAAIIVATLDAVIFVVYIIMLLMLRRMEKKTASHLEGNLNSVDGYTVKIGNLPQANRAFLKRELWKHFSQVRDHNQTLRYNVVDVQLAESQYLLDLQVRSDTLKKKKGLLTQRFCRKWVNQAQAKQNIVTDEDLRQFAMKGNQKMISEYHSIGKLKNQMDKLARKINQEKNHKQNCPTTAFVTFETKEQRDEIYIRYQKSPFRRFCYSFCKTFYNKNDVNIFHGNYLKVKDAPSTHNILWANVGVSKTERFSRRLVSWAITVLFWAISFGLILIVKAQQEDAFDIVRPTQNCAGYENVTEAEAEADSALGNQSLGLTECFCRGSLERQLLVGICRTWRTKKLLSEGLPFLVIGGIILTNYALQYVFKLLSSFERHQSLSSESSSRVIKIFVAQVLNTGVIILLVNARFARNRINNVLEGRYDDLTTEWYLNVGTTVLMTMIVNIVNLPIINIFFYLLRGCFRLFDRDCTCNEQRTTKETHEDYVKLYTGPEFLVDFRYAQILTMVFICFIYSPGMPLLFPTILLSLFFIYWMDKILLLKICKLPKNFDDRLENVVRHILFFAMFFHLIFAVWTYGNPEIFDNVTSYVKNNELVTAVQNKEKTYVFSSMWDRAREDYNIVLTVLFALLVGGIIATALFRNTIKRFAHFCLSKRGLKVVDESKYSNQKSYFDYIHLEDLQRERVFLYNEMNETQDDELRELLNKRIEQIAKEIGKRDPAEENHLTKFLGPFSYYVGHNDHYKEKLNPKDVQVEHAPSIARLTVEEKPTSAF